MTVLYQCEEDVAVGMAGDVPAEKNGHISVEVRRGREWSGTLELWDPETRLPDSAMLRGEDGEELPFRVVRRIGLLLRIEQHSKFTRSPCTRSLRTASDVVQVFDEHLNVLDQGLALVEVFNDETWKAVVYLEGDGSAFVNRRSVYVARLGGDVASPASVGFSLEVDESGAAVTLALVGVGDSVSPL
jgi:hypothetical protein